MEKISALALLFAAAILTDGASASTVWILEGEVTGARCGNYCAVERHNGLVYLLSNSYSGKAVGSLYGQRESQEAWQMMEGVTVLSREVLRGPTDERGQEMDFVRTVGLATDGELCHVLLHVGAEYGNDYYNYRPAYAVGDDCLNLTYVGPISVDGVVQPPTFSSSMAFEIKDGLHYQLQDSGCYGHGRLCLLSSTNGFDYQSVAPELWPWADDQPSWPELSYCGGFWYVLANRAWDDPQLRIIRAASLEVLAGGIDAESGVERLDEAGQFFKGINVFCDDGVLIGFHAGQRYRLNWKP